MVDYRATSHIVTFCRELERICSPFPRIEEEMQRIQWPTENARANGVSTDAVPEAEEAIENALRAEQHVSAIYFSCQMIVKIPRISNDKWPKECSNCKVASAIVCHCAKCDEKIQRAIAICEDEAREHRPNLHENESR